jgi:hypothetical protein
MKKILCESLEEFLNEEGEPLAIAILGAPAGGKSFTMKNITKTVKDARIEDTIKFGVNLSVDVLRDEFRSKEPTEQLIGFVKAYYYMKDKAAENAEQFGGWFKEIIMLWNEKLSKLVPVLKIHADENDLTFQEKSALQHAEIFKNTKIDSAEIIKQLDQYKDFKRVVRYFQGLKQEQVIDKQMNVTYDESGDEPLKIVDTLKKYHLKGYVTDVFLIHPENIASNLIQNYFRVLKGQDGGRDSSEAMINAYLDIEKNKNFYKFNSEDVLKTTSKELQKDPVDPKIENPIKNANVADDKRRGNKPIDVFTEVSPMKPVTAFNFFYKQLDREQRKVFLALLKYRMLTIHNLPQNAKDSLAQITKSINNQQALQILQKAAESKKYVFQYGGVTPELVKKAETVLK